MMFQRKPRRPKVEIIPMVDVVFFLLVFFMFFTTFRTAVSGIPIELPESKQAVELEQERVVVTINSQGQIFLSDPAPLSLERLVAALEPMVARNPNLLVILNADSEVRYGRLIEVMDVVTSTGVTLPALGVEKERERR